MLLVVSQYIAAVSKENNKHFKWGLDQFTLALVLSAN